MSQKGALQNILWLDFHDKIPPTIWKIYAILNSFA
jgi:hypothetical protein